MGQVFLALRPVEGEPTDEVCVVKTVRTDLKDDREAVGRFLDEARIVQRLDHPNICHTLDAGVIDKTYYVALEFISGRNLRDVQTRAQKLGQQVSDDVIYHSMIAMLDALAYAHAAHDPDTGKHLGVVHRDVSPHNVMLGFDGYVKLIDFGLAAHGLKRELTRPGIMVGKLRYNAPEQVRDRALDGRSDLYSAGVMLYELVTGERFYEGLSEEEIWRVAMKGTYRPKGITSVTRDLRNVLELALAPEPEGRFASAAAMKDAVDELARTRGLREGRRKSARFMGDIFGDERQLERDMILQATGLAEARTRLFEKPSELESNIKTDEPSVSVSSVGRTKIVSPAQVRGRLQSLVSSFDPNAETAYGEAPQWSAERSISGAESDPFRTSKPGEIERMKERATEASPTTRASSMEADTVVQRHSTSTPKAPPRAPHPHADENLRADMRADAPPTASQQNLAARPPRNVNTGSQRPVRLQPERRVAPLAALGGGLVMFLLVAIAAAAYFIEPDEPPKPVRVDAPVDVQSPPVDEKPIVEEKPVEAKVVEEQPVVEEKPVVEEQPVVEEKVVERQPPDAGAADEAVELVEAPPPPPPFVQKVEKKQKPPPPPPPPVAMTAVKEEKPPVRPLRTLKEQVDYLTQYCVGRVACARSTTEDAKNLVSLSPEETKSLMTAIQKCIQRCQR